MSKQLSTNAPSIPVAIIGAGPAGLLAAQRLGAAGVAVQVFDAMPTAARKFLLAGRGGLNLTHSEDFAPFVQRYGQAATWLEPLLRDFGRDAVRAWAQDLGVETFVGTSGRIFPTEMKAAPLLRAWLHRLRQPMAAGSVPVVFHMRQRWLGWADDAKGDGKTLRFATPDGEKTVHAQAVLLALGGASWPRLGSTGDWVDMLRAQGVKVHDLQAANCGFDAAGRAGAGWTARLQELAGQPLKNIVLPCASCQCKTMFFSGWPASSCKRGVQPCPARPAASKPQLAASKSSTFAP